MNIAHRRRCGVSVILARGVATGWTGVDWVGLSTPLLPEAVPKIDANPVSLVGGWGGQ